MLSVALAVLSGPEKEKLDYPSAPLSEAPEWKRHYRTSGGHGGGGGGGSGRGGRGGHDGGGRRGRGGHHGHGGGGKNKGGRANRGKKQLAE